MSTQPPMSEPIIENPEGTVSRTEIRNKRKAQKKVAKTEKIAKTREAQTMINKLGNDKKNSYISKTNTRQRRQINQARGNNH